MRSDSESKFDPSARSFSRDRDGDADERRQSSGSRKRSRSRSRSPYRRGIKRERRDSYSQNDRMVYISNIPYDVRWMEIKDLVREKAGEVVFVEILEDRFGKSKGAAVVEFRDKDSVQKCVDGLHRYQMKDRLVVAKEIRDPVAFFRKVKEDTGVDFLAPNGRLSRGSTGMGGGGMRGGPPERMPSSGTYDTFGLSPVFLHQLGIEGPLCNRVFVANLAYNIQSGKVWEVFSLAGKVSCVDLQLDKEGKSKGLGVIEYSHPIEAVQAISMLNNQRLYDRTITVKMDKYEKPTEKMPGELPRGLQGVGMGLGANGAPLTDIASVLNSVNTPGGPGPMPPVPGPAGGGGYGGYGAGPTTGYGFGAGGGTPQGNYQNAASGVQGGYGGGGGGPSPGGYGASVGPQGGYGGVSSGMQSGFGANGPMQGGYSSGATGGFGSQPSTGSANGGYGGGYQSSTNSMDSGYGRGGGMGGDFGDRGAIPISHSPSRAIVINNLPPDYTWQIVRDRTRQYGDVEFVDIVTPGSCKVRFKNVADAERARGALQGTTVEGRVIAVDFLFD